MTNQPLQTHASAVPPHHLCPFTHSAPIVHPHIIPLPKNKPHLKCTCATFHKSPQIRHKWQQVVGGVVVPLTQQPAPIGAHHPPSPPTASAPPSPLPPPPSLPTYKYLYNAFTSSSLEKNQKKNAARCHSPWPSEAPQVAPSRCCAPQNDDGSNFYDKATGGSTTTFLSTKPAYCKL